MSIFKRGNVYWYHFYFNGQHIQESTKQGNPRVARQMEAAHRTSLAKGEVGIRDKKTAPLFGKFADEFLDRVKPEIGPRTHSRYVQSLKPLREYFSFKRLDEITPDEIQKYRQVRIEKGSRRKRPLKDLSPATLNRDLACLRRILLFAVKLDLILVTPFMAHKVKFLREQGRERILGFDEERRYLAAAGQPLRDTAIIMLENGLRPNEIRSICAEDVHLSAVHPYLHIPGGKTNNARRDVSLTARTAEIFKRRCADAKGKHLFPFRISPGHYDWSKPMVKLHHAHYEALKRSGIRPSFQIYDLRHTYGTRSIEAGTDPLSLMKIMGHADLRTTQRYVHLSRRHLIEAQAKIEHYRASREIAEAEAAQKSALVTLQ